MKKTRDNEIVTSDNLNKQTGRNYGVDLLRIISMFMVCLLHVLGRGGVLNSAEPQSAVYYAAWLIEIVAYCAVNCYALISGYVGVNSKYKISNLIYLWLQVAFYSVGISVIFKIINYGAIGWTGILKSFLPVTFNQYWYFTAYFGLFLFIPFLNVALHKIPQRIAKWSLIIIVAFITIFSRLNGSLFWVNDGYSALWLIVLYLVGGYVKLYNPFKEIKTWKLTLILIGLLVITWLSKIIIEFATLKIFGQVKGSGILISYLSPTIFMVAVLFLLVFTRINLKHHKLIAFFVPVSFGVYLIHVHPLIWSYVVKDFAVGFASFNPVLMVLAVIGSAVVIYIVCLLIDYIRLLLFRLLKIRPLLLKIENKIKNKLIRE